MNENLAIMRNKYRPVSHHDPKAHSAAIEATPRLVKAQPRILRTWRDSEAVVRLSGYLKRHKAHGITLVNMDGKATLHFEPGIQQSEGKRWAVAKAALRLFSAAATDLVELMRKGKLNLTKHPQGVVTRKLWVEE